LSIQNTNNTAIETGAEIDGNITTLHLVGDKRGNDILLQGVMIIDQGLSFPKMKHAPNLTARSPFPRKFVPSHKAL
jgi:hypothetical protein